MEYILYITIGGRRGGLGWLQPPSWAQIFFNRFSFLAKDSMYFGIFLCLFYKFFAFEYFESILNIY